MNSGNRTGSHLLRDGYTAAYGAIGEYGGPELLDLNNPLEVREFVDRFGAQVEADEFGEPHFVLASLARIENQQYDDGSCDTIARDVPSSRAIWVKLVEQD